MISSLRKWLNVQVQEFRHEYQKEAQRIKELEERDFSSLNLQDSSGSKNGFLELYRSFLKGFKGDKEKIASHEEDVKYQTCTEISQNNSLNIESKRTRKISLSTRVSVLSRDRYKCVFCGRSSKEASLEIDHIIPFSKGGSNSLENLQTLCFECNRGKGDRILD